MVQFLENFYYPGILLLLLLCGLGVPIPEDITLVTAGFLAAQGAGRIDIAILISIVGVLAGDCMLFGIGHRYGRDVQGWPLIGRVLTDTRIEKARWAYREYGGSMIFASRFLAGVRAAFHLAAGMLGVPFWKFVIYDGLASLVSVPLIVSAGWYYSDDIEKLLKWEHRGQWIIVSIIVLIVGALAGYHRWRKKHPQPLPPRDSARDGGVGEGAGEEGIKGPR